MKKKSWAILLLLVVSGCTRLFFYPLRPHVLTPADLGLKHADLYVRGKGKEVLHGWLLPGREPVCGSILFLHGNAENISTHIASVYWLPEERFNIYAFDYPGYGASSGTPSVEGTLATFDLLLAQIRREQGADARIVVYGQSVGAALAISGAAVSAYKNTLSAVVAEASFASYRAIAREKLDAVALTKLLQWPLSLLFLSSFDPEKEVGNISPVPLLLIHGQSDVLVPPEHSLELFAEAKEPKELWLIENEHHITVFRSDSNRQKLAAYLRRVTDCGVQER